MITYRDIFLRLSAADTFAELNQGVDDLLTYFDIQHASFWGVDKTRKRVFFVSDLTEKTPVANEGIRVLDFSQSFLGTCVNTETPKVQIRTGLQEIEETRFVAKDFIIRYEIRQIQAIPRMNRTDYTSVFLLGRTKEIKYTDHDRESLRIVVFLFDVFISQYARIRNKRYRELLLNLAESSLEEHTSNFLKAVYPAVKDYLGPVSFSVWQRQIDGKLHNLFFSNKSADSKLIYDAMEGATGTCFSTGRSFLSHRMTDLIVQEQIRWQGKFSDFETPPKHGDHGIFVPILLVKGQDPSGDSAGVLRLTLSEDSHSFWPHDLETGQTIAKLIALRFSHDALLSRLREENEKLLSLLHLSGEVSRLGTDVDFSKKAFDSLVENYHLSNIAYVVYDIKHGRPDIRFNMGSDDTRIKEYSRAAAKAKTSPNKRTILLPGGTTVVLRLGGDRIEELQQLGLIILEFSQKLTEEDGTALEVFSAVLEIAWANSRMFQERQTLLAKWERAEAANRAGIIARESVHEVKQGCMEIFAWIENSKRSTKGPNFDALEAPLKVLEQHALDMLSRSEMKYNPTSCCLNSTVRAALRSYGVKGDEPTLQGHPLRVSYGSELWQKNSGYYVEIDPDAMVSVLRNLLNNSIEQYSRFEKHGPIEITTEFVQEKKKKKACLTIRDYAGGVSPDIRDKMWSAFETDKPQGSGIGLFSVNTFVTKKMSGEIDEVGNPPSAIFKITIDVKRGGKE